MFYIMSITRWGAWQNIYEKNVFKNVPAVMTGFPDWSERAVGRTVHKIQQEWASLGCGYHLGCWWEEKVTSKCKKKRVGQSHWDASLMTHASPAKPRHACSNRSPCGSYYKHVRTLPCRAAVHSYSELCVLAHGCWEMETTKEVKHQLFSFLESL